MNSLLSILFKNLVLLVLVVISLIFIFTQFIGYKEVRYVFAGLGLLYVLASLLEARVLSSVKSNTRKFTYFPDGLIAKRVIKIIAFIVIGILLYYSGSIIRYMAFICFIIALTEIFVTVWRRIKNLCFVAMEDDQLIISTNKIETTSAREIQKIETRHGLTYFVNYSGKAITLRTDMMQDAEGFMDALNQWIMKNNLSTKVISG